MEEKLEVKSFEIKADKQESNLYIEGYGLRFGNLDSWNDIIEPGAVDAFMDDEKARRRCKLCAMHDMMTPIGVIEEMKVDENGLWFRAKISNTDAGKDMAILIEDGVINEFSIGYRAKKWWYDEEKEIRHLTDIYLYEISAVTRAANDEAVLTNTERKGEGEMKQAETQEEVKGENSNIKQENEMEEKMNAEVESVKTDLDGVKTQIENSAKEQEQKFENLDASIAELEAKMNEMKAEKKAETIEGALVTMVESPEFKAGLESVVNGEKVSFKANITTGSVTGDVNRTMNDTRIHATAIQNTVLLGRVAVNNVPQDKNRIMFIDGAYTSNADYVGEGAAHGTDDVASIEEHYRELAKVEAVLPFTREIASDFSYFINWVKNRCLSLLINKVDTLCFSGDGADSSSSLKKHVYGLIGHATAFNATTAGVAAVIANPALYNLIDAIRAQISLGTNDEFVPSEMWIHPSTFAKYKNMRDANGQLLFAQNGGIYNFLGLTVHQTSKINADALLVGSAALADLYEKGGVEIEIERKANTDSYVMYVRWRGNFVVTSEKKRAFIYCASIQTALAAIAGNGEKLYIGQIGVSGISATGATLGWDAVTGATGYKISTDNINWGAEQAGTSKVLSGLTAGTSYTYYVKAVGTGKVDSDSQSVTFTTAAE